MGPTIVPGRPDPLGATVGPGGTNFAVSSGGDHEYAATIAGDLYGGNVRTDASIIPVANARIMARLLPDATMVHLQSGHPGGNPRPCDALVEDIDGQARRPVALDGRADLAQL